MAGTIAAYLLTIVGVTLTVVYVAVFSGAYERVRHHVRSRRT